MDEQRVRYTPLERVRRRKTALWNDRSPWDAKARNISRYIYPTGGRWHTTDRNRGEVKHGYILNSTPLVARRTLSAGLMAGATSPARPWFRLDTPDADLNQYDPVKRWLHQLSVLMRDIFSKSNTYEMLHMLYDEVPSFGTGAALIYDDFDTVLHCVPLTFGEYALATNHKQQIQTMVREYPMTVEELVENFGYERCSITVRNQYDRGNYYQKIPVMHMIAPRSVRDLSRRDAKNMRFESIHVEAAGNSTDVLRESGFQDFPALGVRWRRTAGDTYGNGPGDEAVGDAMELQDKELKKAQILAYRANPPLQIPTALKESLDILPGGSNYYDQATPHGGIRSAFEVDLDYDGVLRDIERTEKRIEKTMFTDLFLMLATMDIGSRQMTAREIAERHEEKLLMLGPVLESLHNELLGPLIDITFAKCVRAGIVPRPPREMEDQELKVEFVSVLAQAQRAVGLGSLDRLIGVVSSIAAAKQDASAWDKLDTDQITDIYADMLGADPDAVVADDKVAIIRAERQRAQEAANTVNAMGPVANAAKAASETDTSGQNGLTDLLSSMQGYS